MNTVINSNQPHFGAGYHVYFFTNDGKRIVSDENMKKCLHYMESHLNNSKRVKVRNTELVDTFKFGKKVNGEYTGGDKDYYNISKIRSVIDNTKDKIQGFINIVTGSDVKVVDEKFGKDIGKAKHISIKRAGTTNTFETKTAINKYVDNAPDYAESRAVYKDGERQAFGIAFTPVYYTKGKHQGEVKGFEYHSSGFFNESKISK